jgi:5'-nucleotidase
VNPANPKGEIGRLLTELPRGTFDVMVLGHAHTVLAHRYEDTFLLENRYRGHALGRVDLVIGPDGVDLDASRLHAPWPIEHPPADPGCEPGEYDLTPRMLGERLVTPSAEAVALIDALEAETGSLCAELGCADAHLWRARDKESPAGDFMADAMRHTFPTADLAVANSGGVRADLPAGVVRREHLQAMMPFDNRLLLVELRGADLDALLTIGSSGGHGLLQVSGATYAFDPERTTGEDRDADGAIADWERDRLCSAAVGGAPIDPDRAYRVVVTDFLLGGGDHLGGPLANARVLEEGPLLREALYDAMSARGGECLGAVIDESAPRIRVGACGD